MHLPSRNVDYLFFSFPFLVKLADMRYEKFKRTQANNMSDYSFKVG
jgi:hypothetical protein